MRSALASVAARLNREREKNHGMVPKDLFPLVTSIGGAYPAIEVIVRVLEKGQLRGFALRKRGGHEQGWHGEYHVIGTAVRKTDTPKRIFARLAEELGMRQDRLERRLHFFSHAFRFERPRDAVGFAVVFLLDITPSEGRALPSDWAIFQKSEIRKAEIIDFHKTLLLRTFKKKQPLLPYESH